MNSISKITVNRNKWIGWIGLIESLAILIYYISIPSDAENVILLRYSSRRLLLLGLIGSFVFAHVVLILNTNLVLLILERPVIRCGLITSSYIFWLLSVSDPLWPIQYIGYLHQLRPLMVLFALVFLQGYILVGEGLSDETFNQKSVTIIKVLSRINIYLVGFIIFSKPFWTPKKYPLYDQLSISAKWILYTSLILILFISILRAENKKNRSIKTLFSEYLNKYTLVPIGIFLILWGLIYLTGLGVGKSVDLWNPGGVPVQLHQIVLLVFYIIDIHSYVGRYINKNGRWSLGVAIWVVAAVFWLSHPVGETRTFTKPSPPENLIIPLRDAAHLDAGAQSILIGEGVSFGHSNEKPLYQLFLAGVYGLINNDFNTAITIQVMMLSLIPVLTYFIGSKIINDQFGILLALYTIVQELNAYAMIKDEVAVHSKMLMSEPLMEFLVILLIFLTYIYIAGRDNQYRLSVIIGVVFGLAGLTRLNGFLLFPLIVLFLLFISRFQKRVSGYYKSILVMVTIFAIIITPYSIYTTRATGYPFFVNKAIGVLARYIPRSEVREIVDRFGPSSGEDGIPELEENSVSVVPANESSDEKTHKKVIEHVKPFLAHFVNNEIMTLVEFPLDFGFTPMERFEENPIWHQNSIWDGRLDSINLIFFNFNLLFLALGIGWMVKQQKIAGMVPLVYHIGYNITNASALTSGGRYLVPSEWGLYFYYIAGLYVVFSGISFSNQKEFIDESPVPKSFPTKTITMVAVLCALIISILIPTIELLIPDKYPVSQGKELITLFGEKEFQSLAEHNVTEDDILDFLNQPSAKIYIGRGAYPRLTRTIDEEIQFSLNLINPKTVVFSKLLKPDSRVRHFPHLGDTIVIGCSTNAKSFTALIMISLEEPLVVKSRYFSGNICDSYISN